MVACGGSGSPHPFASVLVLLLTSSYGVGGDATGFPVAPSHLLSLNEIFGAGLSPGKSKLIFCAPLDMELQIAADLQAGQAWEPPSLIPIRPAHTHLE